MSRISKLEAWMRTAEAWGERSTCARPSRQVGAVLTSANLAGDWISIGYNGVHAGGPNRCAATPEAPCTTCLHAELNALAKPRPPGESILFVTLEPCLPCARYLLGKGIREVYFRDFYREHDGVELLRAHGVPCFHLPRRYPYPVAH